jgi:hypothetical protein
MADDELFWGNLLAYICDRKLVTIAGPELNVITVDGISQTLTAVIAKELVKKYSLRTDLPRMTMAAAAAAAVREDRGRAGQLHVVIHQIILAHADKPCLPLSALAAITDLKLFVSTTPDRILAREIDNIRVGGPAKTREVAFSPMTPTAELDAENDRAPQSDETIVLSLFGRSSSALDDLRG